MIPGTRIVTLLRTWAVGSGFESTRDVQQFASAARLWLTGSAQRLRPPGIEFTGSNQVGERAELPVRMQPKVARQRHRFGQQSSVP